MRPEPIKLPDRGPEPPIFCIFTRGVDVLDRLILWWTRADVNHAAFAFWSIEFNCWMTVGANANGVTLMTMTQFRKTREIPYVLAPVGFSLWDGLRKHAGDIDKGYNYAGLFGMAFVEVARTIGSRHPINYFNDRQEVFCSEWVEEVVFAGVSQAGVGNQWRLAKQRPSTVDPGLLCRTEIASPMFHEYDAGLFDHAWRP